MKRVRCTASDPSTICYYRSLRHSRLEFESFHPKMHQERIFRNTGNHVDSRAAQLMRDRE